jgi:hypothetical protein
MRRTPYLADRETGLVLRHPTRNPAAAQVALVRWISHDGRSEYLPQGAAPSATRSAVTLF